MSKKAEDIDNVDLESVRPHVEILRWVKQREKELKDLEANARAEIEAAMGSQKYGTLDGERVVHWNRYKSRRLNQKALKADHPDLVEEYTELSETSRFSLVNPDLQDKDEE